MEKSMGRSLTKAAFNFIDNGSMKRTLMSLLTYWLLVSCGAQGPDEKGLEVNFRDVEVDATAVSEILPLISPSHRPEKQHLSPAQQSLFTYLAKTEPAKLVATEPHGQGTWRIEKIFILDDCVAVQMTEGHYLETLFFVQNSNGWRLIARVQPQDHEEVGKP
jgi:hypothetical protein